jgi:S1-C subfamily serine protease
MKESFLLSRKKSGVVIPAVGIIVIVIIIGVLASLVAMGNLSNSTVTTTETTTVPTTNTLATTQAITTLSNSSDASSQLNAEAIYAAANLSIVTVQGDEVQSSYFGQQVVPLLGSGFVIVDSGQYYIITNYHVAGSTSNLTVTFPDGNSYTAQVVGSDPYSDLAIIKAPSAPPSEFYPLTIVSSSSLQVGDSVAAIGNPYGLTGSMTVGIVSQLGRTIQDPTSGNFSIANVIQFSAPINPGNSGGALLNSEGNVVGITTATVSSSQGIGFAIPSDTILKELPSLISTGSYNSHAYLGIDMQDMNYQLAQAIGANVTYGVLIADVLPGGPAATAGLLGGNTTATIDGQQYKTGGDIIVSINGTRVIDSDSLATYLEEHAVAGQMISVGVIRNGTHYMTVSVTLGARPSIS